MPCGFRDARDLDLGRWFIAAVDGLGAVGLGLLFVGCRFEKRLRAAHWLAQFFNPSLLDPVAVDRSRASFEPSPGRRRLVDCGGRLAGHKRRETITAKRDAITRAR